MTLSRAQEEKVRVAIGVLVDTTPVGGGYEQLTAATRTPQQRPGLGLVVFGAAFTVVVLVGVVSGFLFAPQDEPGGGRGILDQPLMSNAVQIDAEDIYTQPLRDVMSPGPDDSLFAIPAGEHSVLVRVRDGVLPHVYATSCDVIAMVELPSDWESTCLEKTVDGRRVTGVFHPSSNEPPPLDQATNSQVFLSNDSDLAVVDVDEGTVFVDPVPELAPGDPLYRLVRRGDQLGFYGQTDIGPAVYVVDVTNPTSPELIDDDAWFFIPAAEDDRIWVAGLDESSPETVRALDRLREMSVDTGVVVREVTPPDGRWPVAAVSDGLLFQGDDTIEIWDPEVGEFIRTLPGPFPVAAWRNRVVTCGACDQITLTDLDNDTQRTIDVPVGVAYVDGYRGAFSPDGRWVAIPALLTPPPITEQTRLAVVLVDFENETVSVIPGTNTSNRVNFPQVAWNSEGDWLFIGPVYNEDDEGSLLAYRPGDDTAYTVPGSLNGTFYAMAAD